MSMIVPASFSTQNHTNPLGSNKSCNEVWCKAMGIVQGRSFPPLPSVPQSTSLPRTPAYSLLRATAAIHIALGLLSFKISCESMRTHAIFHWQRKHGSDNTHPRKILSEKQQQRVDNTETISYYCCVKSINGKGKGHKALVSHFRKRQISKRWHKQGNKG